MPTPLIIHPRSMTWEQYVAIDAVHWSTLREMRRSPLHYRWRRDHPPDETAPMRFGRAVHCAILEPDRFEREYLSWDGDRRGNAWKAFEADATEAGKEVLRAVEHEECLALRDAVRAHALASKYLAQGRAEQVIAWIDPETGLQCKARLDWICDVPGMAALIDLKSTAELEAYRLGASIARLGHHSQLAFYARGLRALGLLQPTKLVTVESEAPWDVAVWAVEGDALAAGDDEVGRLLRRVKECEEAGAWDGRYDAIEQQLRLPAWLFREAEEMEPFGLIVGGREV